MFLYTGIGFGLLAAGAGIGAGSATSTATSGCTAGLGCSPEAKDARGTALKYAIISDIGLGLAIASFLGFYFVPAHVKVGVSPTKNGVAATTGWSFW